ncbi:germination protein YpeB [Cohnella fermenti]|uniref:Germination protein YpeB n=1 Tax=Cohnella fermenti TaxID=2565925 RepID=A0A4V3WEZ8_9BACL|nr:germination protein YpeB [Cohnella fermenti]THF78348.1 germination protein YpeB [Cohnella fermenti]
MYARLSSVLFPIAAILLVGSLIWGYQEHQEKNSVLIKAENQYQRAFHDLTNHMSRLQDELGQTLAVNSVSQGAQRKGLVKVWRLTSEAQNEVNQLPLALLPFNQASDFLSRISDFAYSTSVRDLTKQPLTNDELKTMKSLYAKASDINKDLDKVESAVLSDRLRWMDVEVAMASKDEPGGSTIIDGFKAVDKKIGSYPENDWGPSSMSTKSKKTVQMLTGPDTSSDEIKQKALSFLGTRAFSDKESEVKVEETGTKTQMPIYSVTIKSKNGDQLSLDYTRKGGELLWYMNPRKVAVRKLSLDETRNKASQFLLRHGYKDMTPITYDQYDHVSVFTFVRQQDNVKVYPDKVTVRIAMDNGEAVGLQAKDHVFAEKTTKLAAPKIAKQEAAKVLHPEFKVQGYSLSLIENEEKKQVLCHEFVGKVNGSSYRMYINADTGVEESIEKIPESAKALLK